MGEKSTHKFCNELFINLTDDFWFYIPDNAVINESIELSDLLELRSFLNMVVVMDWQKGPNVFEENLHKYDELKKSSILGKNVMQLIDKKEKLDPSSFEFIFSKYYDQVRVMGMLSFWLNDESRLEQIDNKGINTYRFFQLQCHIIEKHFEELEKVFCVGKTEVLAIQTEGKLELQLPILLNQLEKIESNQIENAKIVQEIVATSNVHKKQEKTIVRRAKNILITEQEAEKLLLATVFGINFKV